MKMTPYFSIRLLCVVAVFFDRFTDLAAKPKSNANTDSKATATPTPTRDLRRHPRHPSTFGYAHAGPDSDPTPVATKSPCPLRRIMVSHLQAAAPRIHPKARTVKALCITDAGSELDVLILCLPPNAYALTFSTAIRRCRNSIARSPVIRALQPIAWLFFFARHASVR